MAPRNSRGKAHKTKGEKKKKEEKSLPIALDILVNLPGSNQIVLKGISTDRILDVRRLLAVNVATCHLTNYSLSHEVRGNQLRDSVEVVVLKPCVLTLVEEEYTAETAVSHIRRVLDIFSSTTYFGPSAKQSCAKSSKTSVKAATLVSADGKDSEPKNVSPDTAAPQGGRQELKDSSSKANIPDETHEFKIKKPFKHTLCCRRGLGHENEDCKHICCQENSREEMNRAKSKVYRANVADNGQTEKGDTVGLAPPSKLGQFYEFFSFAHLTSPIHFLRRSVKQQQASLAAEDLFSIDLKLCNGKILTVISCTRGFSCSGKQQVKSHTLVDLLRQCSKAFSNAYEDLIKAFVERNKFGNTPYGLRANSWVVPPVAADFPFIFPPLPAEDETWGGTGGGHGGHERNILRPWAKEFLILAKMASQTAEERQVRDHKAFILHNMFVDTAVTQGTDVINHVAELVVKGKLCSSKEGKIYEECRGTLKVSVIQAIPNASKKRNMKVDGLQVNGMTVEEIREKSLLKGITADESTTVHDTATLGLVIVHHLGYVAVVEAADSKEEPRGEELAADIDIDNQPEGGANALNVNSLRTLLHDSSSRFTLDSDEQSKARTLIGEIMEKSLICMDEQESDPGFLIRWELGACWLQHLQTQATADKPDEKNRINKRNTTVKKSNKVQVTSHSHPQKVEDSDEHLSGKARLICDPLGLNKKLEQRNHIEKTVETVEGMKQKLDQKENAEAQLKCRLSDAAFTRLKESKSGLHLKSIADLTDEIQIYYNDVAIPKLVSDFGSLELSPVDGRTLTDFMHTRGLRMCSLGRVAELSGKLPHVQSLCIHEMVIRSLKSALRAVVAATKQTSDLSLFIATTLNLMLGTHSEEVLRHGCKTPESMISLWLMKFIERRFGWKLASDPRPELRKYAILRGICHKVGIEIAPRDYELEMPTPFTKMDIISMVPVYKQVACSSADGRTLLELSKTALDKGKLDDAVAYGTKALGKLIAVCGPYHRMTAGAYSLLAVVLYHTGDFSQATIYQQKALDINERELGLDHPDTMKSYGDLAVFYYRLHHTELALKYVNRALYLLHLICGPAHPNTAATYINVAMMEEGLGNVHVALRYLHEALKCNQRLLGPDHIQTAASYHAIAIALSLIELYSLSVQHEQTTLQILQEKLGQDDLRTQDAAAWLEYFDSKAVEQQEAARTGAPKPDALIASKGHLSVSDLLDYINAGIEKEKDIELFTKKSRHLKPKERSNDLSLLNMDDLNKELNSDEEQRSSEDINADKEKYEGIHRLEALVEKGRSLIAADFHAVIVHNSLPDATCGSSQEEEGWQEAVPRSQNPAAGHKKPWRRGLTLGRTAFHPINKNNSIIQDNSLPSLDAAAKRNVVTSATNKGSTPSDHSAGRLEKVYVPEKVANLSLPNKFGPQLNGNVTPPDSGVNAQFTIGSMKSVAVKNVASVQRPHSPCAEVAIKVSLPPEQAISAGIENEIPKLSTQTSSPALIYSPSSKPAPSYKEVALAAPGTCLLVRPINEASALAKPQLEGNGSQQPAFSTPTPKVARKESLSQQNVPSDTHACKLESTETTAVTVTAPLPPYGNLEILGDRKLERNAPQGDQASPSYTPEIVPKPFMQSENVVISEAPSKPLPDIVSNEKANSAADHPMHLDSNDSSIDEEQSEMPLTPSSSLQTPKRLLAAAPPFNSNASLGRITSVGIVAVTPFKDGKAPQSSGGLSPRSFTVSSKVTAIAVTPIRQSLELLSVSPSESSLELDETCGNMTLVTSPIENTPAAIEFERESPLASPPSRALTPTPTGGVKRVPSLSLLFSPPPEVTLNVAGHSASLPSESLPPSPTLKQTPIEGAQTTFVSPTSTQEDDFRCQPAGEITSRSLSDNSPSRPTFTLRSLGLVNTPGKSMNPNAAEFIPGRIWRPSQHLVSLNPAPLQSLFQPSDYSPEKQQNGEKGINAKNLHHSLVQLLAQPNPNIDYSQLVCSSDGSLTSHTSNPGKLQPESESMPPSEDSERYTNLTIESIHGHSKETDAPDTQTNLPGAVTTKLWADIMSGTDSEREHLENQVEAPRKKNHSFLSGPEAVSCIDQIVGPTDRDVKLHYSEANKVLGLESSVSSGADSSSLPNPNTENGNTAFEVSESGISGSDESAPTSDDLQQPVHDEMLPYVNKPHRSRPRRMQALRQGDTLCSPQGQGHRRRSYIRSTPASLRDSFRTLTRRSEGSHSAASPSPTECLLPAQAVVSVR